MTGSRLAQIRYVEIRGDVVMTGATLRVQLLGSTVRGGATLNDNVTLGVGANTIQGTLSCTGNSEVRSYGFPPSTVAGANTGQCAGF